MYTDVVFVTRDKQQISVQTKCIGNRSAVFISTIFGKRSPTKKLRLSIRLTSSAFSIAAKRLSLKRPFELCEEIWAERSTHNLNSYADRFTFSRKTFAVFSTERWVCLNFSFPSLIGWSVEYASVLLCNLLQEDSLITFATFCSKLCNDLKQKYLYIDGSQNLLEKEQTVTNCMRGWTDSSSKIVFVYSWKQSLARSCEYKAQNQRKFLDIFFGSLQVCFTLCGIGYMAALSSHIALSQKLSYTQHITGIWH